MNPNKKPTKAFQEYSFTQHSDDRRFEGLGPEWCGYRGLFEEMNRGECNLQFNLPSLKLNMGEPSQGNSNSLSEFGDDQKNRTGKKGKSQKGREVGAWPRGGGVLWGKWVGKRLFN